jgi:hypothetical protein
VSPTKDEYPDFVAAAGHDLLLQFGGGADKEARRRAVLCENDPEGERFWLEVDHILDQDHRSRPKRP